MRLTPTHRLYPVLSILMLLFLSAPAFAILQKGQTAPPLKVTTTTGQQVTLANYRGHVLVLDFFATWCAPCRESIPHMINLNRKYGRQGLQILGMSVDEGGEKALKSFIAEKKINYPVALTDEDLQADYGLRSVPTLFVINKKGVVAEKFQGYSDEMGKSMEALIRKLLAE